MNNKEPFYESTWFTILALIVAFPIGVFLMWKYKKFDNASRCVISAAFAIIFFYAILFTNETTASTLSNNETIENLDINYTKI